MMRELTSLDPNFENGQDVGDVFLRGSTPAPIETQVSPEREYTIAVWVLSGLLVILSAVLVFVVVHIIYNHRQLRTLTLFPRRRLKAIQERIDRRYETIEGWIISKRVQEHTPFCETCVRDFVTFDEKAWIQKNNTMDTDQDSQVMEDMVSEEDSEQAHVVVKSTPKADLEMESVHTGERECPICFEEFDVGQVISYSANPNCGHVFHHECIKEWLVHHVTCPFCRKVCMHVDEYRGKQKHEHIDELLELHSKRSATTYYCIKEGLVTIPCRIRCTNSELKKLQSRICDCIVDRKELATMRGGHKPQAENDGNSGHESDTESASMARTAVAAMEANGHGRRVDHDYDPTEITGDGLVIFPQGRIDNASIDNQLTVERLPSTKRDIDKETKCEQPLGL